MVGAEGAGYGFFPRTHGVFLDVCAEGAQVAEVHLEEDGLEDALFSQLQQLLLAAQLPSPLQVLLLTLYVPALAGEELPHVFHTTT